MAPSMGPASASGTIGRNVVLDKTQCISRSFGTDNWEVIPLGRLDPGITVCTVIEGFYMPRIDFAIFLGKLPFASTETGPSCGRKEKRERERKGKEKGKRKRKKMEESSVILLKSCSSSG